jgi:putative membrane protein
MFTNALLGIVALLHLGFLVVEMFLWDKPAGRRIFRTSEEFAKRSRSLAANQGLYNGFLAGNAERSISIWIYSGTVFDP